MSLSVNNTGYSNSQAQSTATSPSTKTSTTADAYNVPTPIIDPTTGKAVISPGNTTISEEGQATLAVWKNMSAEEMKKIEEKASNDFRTITEREHERIKNAPAVNPADVKISVDNIGTNEMALELWSNHLKEDSGISKEAFVDLVHQALSKPSSVTVWSYTTDSIEITLKAAKLEELKNRYVDGSYHQNADRDIQNFIQYQSDALSNLEKNILQDEYQRSVDAGDTDKASTTFLELQKNAEGTSATQLQRQQIFSRAASTDVSAWFGSFRNYIASSDFDRYTKSEYNSIVSEFYNHWLGFQLALK
ncbi:hypothetical protein ABRQ01_02560 [Pectobacterium aroidearum]|uniref:hypothetical protein n=1 Tax=Pectobacterium aroidearum TaxID=1201031 RepID=UPI0032EC7EC4